MIETETWFRINWLMIYKDLKYKLHYRVYKLNYCLYWNIHSNTVSYSVGYILYETNSEKRKYLYQSKSLIPAFAQLIVILHEQLDKLGHLEWLRWVFNVMPAIWIIAMSHRILTNQTGCLRNQSENLTKSDSNSETRERNKTTISFLYGTAGSTPRYHRQWWKHKNLVTTCKILSRKHTKNIFIGTINTLLNRLIYFLPWFRMSICLFVFRLLTVFRQIWNIDYPDNPCVLIIKLKEKEVFQLCTKKHGSTADRRTTGARNFERLRARKFLNLQGWLGKGHSAFKKTRNNPRRPRIFERSD